MNVDSFFFWYAIMFMMVVIAQTRSRQARAVAPPLRADEHPVRAVTEWFLFLALLAAAILLAGIGLAYAAATWDVALEDFIVTDLKGNF